MVITINIIMSKSDPAEYFLKKKLTEEQAHASFMEKPPSVLKDQEEIHDIMQVQEVTKVSVSSEIAQVFDENPNDGIKLPNVTNIIASKCSSEVSIINVKHEDEDDNSTNKSKLMDLLVASKGGSVLATLELDTIIRTMKAKEGEIIDPCEEYTSCENMCSPQVAQYVPY